MGAASYGKRKNQRREGRVSLKGMTRSCGCLFLDSGAHSLYHAHTLGKPKDKRYDWYVNASGNLSYEFCTYLDGYIKFVREYGKGIDHYVTVDAIYNPKISWLSYVYLESGGLSKQVPVVHHRTPLKWVDKYLDHGCKYIGLGGLGQESTRSSYTKWADEVYARLCPAPSYLPLVKTHGFAMASYSLILRYPWYSIDAATWAKAAGFGMILVPHKRGSKFDFGHKPYSLTISDAAKSPRHYKALSPLEKKVLAEWLEFIDVPLGRVDNDGKTTRYGVVSEYNARAVANLKFFTELCNWLPEWPWPFKAKKRSSFF